MSPVRGIDHDKRRLQVGLVEPAERLGDRALGHVLQLRHESGSDLPVRWMIAAKLVAELLAQKLLRVASARIGRSGKRRDADPRGARRALLRLRDEALLAHARQHDVAALDRAIRGWSTARATTGPSPGRQSSAHSARFNVLTGRLKR